MPVSSTQPLVAVIGATGQTGRPLVRELRSRGCRVRAVLRHPRGEAVVREDGAEEVAIGDLADVDSLTPALRGADVVHVIPPVLDPQEPALVANVVRAAEIAGVPRIGYHSVLHPWANGVRHHHRKELAEQVLHESALRWMIMQPAMYAQSALMFAKPVLENRAETTFALPWSVHSRFTLIDVLDIAAATAEVLTNDGCDNGAYELAGGEALSFVEICDVLSSVYARPVEVTSVHLRDFLNPSQTTLGRFADFAAMSAHYDEHGLLGSTVVVRALLSREPKRFIDVAIRERKR